MIVDIEPSVPVRTAEAFAARRMIDRTTDRFGITPHKLAGDAAYGPTETPGRRVEKRSIVAHIPVWGKSKRKDGTVSCGDFVYDLATDGENRPANKERRPYRRNFSKPREPNSGTDGFIKYQAPKHDCHACPIKPQCCPGDPGRRVMRSAHEATRGVARDIRKTDAFMTSFGGARSRCSSFIRSDVPACRR